MSCRLALERALILTDAKTPGATMYACLSRFSDPLLEQEPVFFRLVGFSRLFYLYRVFLWGFQVGGGFRFCLVGFFGPALGAGARVLQVSVIAP